MKKYMLVRFEQKYGEFDIEHRYTYSKDWYDKQSYEDILCQFYCCDKSDLYCSNYECNKPASEGCDCDNGEYEKGDTLVSIYGEQEIDEPTAKLINDLGLSYIHYEKKEEAA
jgi:hypothetical protein